MSSSAESAAPPRVSAPGKILLAGEYVVLDGSRAVVMAVNRRAVAQLDAAPQELSPFVGAVRDLLAGAERQRAARVVVDTAALAADDGTKLGLGSSAAATVCAVACAVGMRDRRRLHALAHRAHATAQAPRGSRGSGADVAASVYGGVAIVAAAAPEEPLAVQPVQLPSDLALLPVWTETPAGTAPLVAAVRRFRAASPAQYGAIANRLADAADGLADAIASDDAGRAVAAIEQGGEAVAELGRAAGTALWLPAHTRIARLMARLGGAVKPTGAGGGDIALVAVPAAAAEAARDVLVGAKLPPLALDVDPDGVRDEAARSAPGRPR
jgi:phosphomevalonate kinase